MKALVYEGVETLALRDAPDPQPADGEAIVVIESAGICGSDMHAFLGHDERRPAPLILGHEAAGVVRGGAMDGRRVTVNPLVTCGVCPACMSGRDNLCPHRQIISMPPREGAIAQAIAIPERNLASVPDHVSLDAAALAEPIACGWHAARIADKALAEGAAAGGLRGVRALVIGGGAIGLGAALSLAAFGAGAVEIVEPNAMRRGYLEDRCGQRAIDPDDLADGIYDLVVDGVGYAATRATASARVRPGGLIMHIGLGAAEGGLDIRRMTLQEISFIGTYTYTAADFRATAAAMFDGALGDLDWIETRALGDGAGAFRDIRAGATAAPKIILKPQ